MTHTGGQSHEPTRAALRWVAAACGPGATVRSVTPLQGATSSALLRIDAERGGRPFGLVLRQFVSAEWLAEEPDLAAHEAASLRAAGRAGIPTPELIASDATGEHCGVPSTLMTLLPGRVELRPADFGDWLTRLSEALVPVHALEAGDHPWSYYPYADVERLEPPRWSDRPRLWERALEIVLGPRPSARECFIHRDYHPTNVLWQDGRVSGVVDWVNACRGPAGIDVAWCRQNLAQMYGVAAADRFLDAYVRASGGGFHYHPYWDLIAVIEHLPGPPGVYPGWPAFGLEGLADEMISRRVEEYVAGVLALV